MAELISRKHLLDRLHNIPDLSGLGLEPVIATRDVLEFIKTEPSVDAAPVVRCAYCKHCFDMGSDPMEPYDGESEWYCARFDRDTSAYEIDPYRFFCADGERRDDDGSTD